MRFKLSLLLVAISFFAFAQKDIYSAAREGNLKIAKKVLKKHPENLSKPNDQGYTPLVLAAYYNQVEMLNFLLKNGVSIPNEPNTSTALHGASYKGFTDCVRILLNNGANPNLTDPNGMTALMFATQFQHIEVVRLLLKNGADPHIPDPNGKTAIDMAIQLGNQDLLDLFK